MRGTIRDADAKAMGFGNALEGQAQRTSDDYRAVHLGRVVQPPVGHFADPCELIGCHPSSSLAVRVSFFSYEPI